MKNLRNAGITALLVVSMLMPSFTVSSFAADVSSDDIITLNPSSGESVEISATEFDQLMTISEDVAESIAMSFLQDALSFEDISWDENTEIVAVKKLYDQSEEPQITAYSFELTSGYIMVSAFWDASALIPEWSDSAEPVYSEFELDLDNNVIYLGPYDFYKDSGSFEVEDIYGNDVPKESLENHVEEMRSVENAPALLIDDIAETIDSDNSGVATFSSITDPFTDAKGRYNERFKCSDYKNTWGKYTPSFYTSYDTPSNYYGECGPVAITNMVLSYKQRYPNCISIPSRETLFKNIASIGIRNGYYVNDSKEGTYTDDAGDYVESVFDVYAITTAISAKLAVNYYNINYQLGRDALLYYAINSSTQQHAVMAFAYTRLVGQSSGLKIVYVKVADGWNSSARYIDISSAPGSIYGVAFP